MTSRRYWFAFALVVFSAFVALAANDPYGDPIPEGAKARLGTTRMRNSFGSGPSTITPDGKFLVGQGLGGGVSFFEPATGKVVRSVKINNEFGTPASFSADGKRAVSTGYDGVFVWDTSSGKVITKVKRAIPGIDGSGVSFSADGKRLAIGGARRDKETGSTAVVWDVDANKAIATVTPVQNDTAYVALSPDGKRLATWGNHYERDGKEPLKPEAHPSRQVQFWDATTGKETAKVHVPGGFNVSAVTLSPDGSLAAASGDGAIYLFDAATGGAKGLLLGRSRQGRKLAFSPDGKTLASAGEDGSVQRWSVADGKRLGTTEPPMPMSFGVRALVFTDNERVVARTNLGVVAVVWEISSGKLLSPAGGHTGGITSAAVAAGGQEILTSGQDGQILRWNPNDGKELGRITLKAPGSIGGFRYNSTLSADGTRALANEGSGGLAVYELPAGTQLFVIPGDFSREVRGSFTPDATKIIQVMSAFDVQKNPARVAVWDIAAAKKLGEIEMPGFSAVSAALTPDGKTLLTAGMKQADAKGTKMTFHVTGWELASGKKLGDYTETGGFGNGFVAAASDNKSAVVATPRGTAVLIDAMTGQKTRDLDIGRAGDSSVPPAVSPDGKTAAFVRSGGFGPSATGTVVLVDLDSGKPKKTLTGVSGNPSVAVFSRDGKLLVTGSYDTTALVWDVSK